jgi:hypothetical protein
MMPRRDNKEGDHDRYAEEWKTARETTIKFDDILIDLRKYGFSFLTGLTTAGTFLGFSSPAQHLQIGVIVVTMVLVMVLYWLDIYYQNLLYGSVLRGRFLEIFKLNRGLGVYIAALYGAAKIGRILHFLYIAFLIGLFILGLFVIDFLGNIGTTRMTKEIMNAFIILLGSFILILNGIITLYFVSDWRRTKIVKEISNIFKNYRKLYAREPDEGKKTLIVNTLEGDVMRRLEKFL